MAAHSGPLNRSSQIRLLQIQVGKDILAQKVRPSALQQVRHHACAFGALGGGGVFEDAPFGWSLLGDACASGGVFLAFQLWKPMTPNLRCGSVMVRC